MHSLSETILLALAALLAGFFGAIVGGGGIVTLPLILATGVSPQVALGTNKMLATITTISSSVVYFKRGFFHPKLWMLAIISTIVTAICGAFFVQQLSTVFIKIFIPILIIIATMYTLLLAPSLLKTSNDLFQSEKFKPGHFSSTLLGGFLGFYSSIAGAGLGIFWTSALQYFYKMDIISASGTARGMCFFSNITAFISFVLFGHVNYFIGTLMGVMMAVGAFFGARSAITFGEKYIKSILFFFAIGTALYLLVTN